MKTFSYAEKVCIGYIEMTWNRWNLYFLVTKFSAFYTQAYDQWNWYFLVAEFSATQTVTYDQWNLYFTVAKFSAIQTLTYDQWNLYFLVTRFSAVHKRQRRMEFVFSTVFRETSGLQWKGILYVTCNLKLRPPAE